MPPYAEIRHYAEGAFRLAKGDAGGMEHFDFSADGFFRSFWAMLIVAPGYAILVTDQHARAGTPGGMALVLAESLSYLLGWVALPIIAVFLTRLFGVAQRYVPLIVALNWSSLIQIAAFLVPLALGVILPGPLIPLLMLLVTGGVLVYQGFIIKTALGCPVPVAVTFLAADLIAVMLINGIVMGLLLGS